MNWYCPDARCGERRIDPVKVDGALRCPTCHATATANAGLNVMPLRHLSADVKPMPR